MIHKTINILILAVILCVVQCQFNPVRGIFSQKIIPLEDYLPICEPHSICKWAVCAWNRNPSLILSNRNCNFYSNHQCDCPENYTCDKSDGIEVQSSIVTYDFRCEPVGK